MNGDEAEARLAEARAHGVEVGLDREAGVMRLKVPRWITADVYATTIRQDCPDDPVEAARQIWNEVAPILRDEGWSDEKIIREYRIPDEVLSGEADRRATVVWARHRLGWIEGEPNSFFRGEPALIAAFRAGEMDEDGFARRLSRLATRVLPRPDAVPPVPDTEVRLRVEPVAGRDDEARVVVDHRPTWRRYEITAARRHLDDYVNILRGRLALDLFLLAQGDEPRGEDVFTPEDERDG